MKAKYVVILVFGTALLTAGVMYLLLSPPEAWVASSEVLSLKKSGAPQLLFSSCCRREFAAC